MGPHGYVPDLTPVFWLAAFGIICAMLLVLGGVGAAIWFVWNHVQIV